MSNGRSRREILTGSSAALLAATLPACGWAQEPPKRKLGYAIVGLGSYATNQIMPRLKDCEFAKLSALISGTPEKLERYGTEYGIPKTHRYSYANYDSIRDNPDIDLVYVVLPNSLHAEYSIRASKAGKHVLCEKPMAVSSAECEAMIAAAKKAGKKLMIGYRSHFEPYNRHGIELIKNGFIGRPRLITSEHGFTISPNQWRLDRPLSGGGSMMDIGIYSLNAARYLSGRSRSKSVRWNRPTSPTRASATSRIASTGRCASPRARWPRACRATARTTMPGVPPEGMAGSGWSPRHPMKGSRCGRAREASPSR